MAVLKKLPGISVTIVSEGKALTEYPDNDHPPDKHANDRVNRHLQARTVTNYIESVDDASYFIKLNIKPPYSIDCSKLGFFCTVDGKEVWTIHATRPDLNRQGGVWERRITGLKELVPGMKRAHHEWGFTFAKVTTKEDADARHVREMRKEMAVVGLIEVRVFREMYGRKGGATTASSNGFIRNSIEVPEKSIKGEAKSHGTALAHARRVQRGDVWRAPKKDGDDFPLAVYKFYYRSPEALKQLHIIERTPSPSPPLSPERDSNGLTEEDNRILKELEEQKRALMERGKKAQHARKAAAKDPRIKREESGRASFQTPLKKKMRKGERLMIDLTDDSDGDEDSFVA